MLRNARIGRFLPLPPFAITAAPRPQFVTRGRSGEDFVVWVRVKGLSGPGRPATIGESIRHGATVDRTDELLGNTAVMMAIKVGSDNVHVRVRGGRIGFGGPLPDARKLRMIPLHAVGDCRWPSRLKWRDRA